MRNSDFSYTTLNLQMLMRIRLALNSGKMLIFSTPVPKHYSIKSKYKVDLKKKLESNVHFRNKFRRSNKQKQVFFLKK